MRQENFAELFVPSNQVDVVEVKHFKSASYGTTYSIHIKINQEYNVFIKFNAKSNRLYKESTKKEHSNALSRLAEFFKIKQNNLKSVIKSANAKEAVEKLFSDQGDRIMKINAVLVKSPNVAIYNVKFDNKSAQTKLKELGCFWDKNERAWKGRLLKSEVDSLKSEFKEIAFNYDKIPEFDKYNAFNVSTEMHVTVSYTEIRDAIAGILNTEITHDSKNINGVYESQINGEFTWEKVILQDSTQDNNFLGSLIISSGNNMSKASIGVMSTIRVAECMNSIQVAQSQRIFHVGDWKKRLEESIKTCLSMFDQAIKAIKMARDVELGQPDVESYINQIKLNLKDPAKIERVREMIRKRVDYEAKRLNKTSVWAVSQALSYIGSHRDEYQEHDFSDALYSRLRTESYAVIENNTSA